MKRFIIIAVAAALCVGQSEIYSQTRPGRNTSGKVTNTRPGNQSSQKVPTRPGTQSSQKVPTRPGVSRPTTMTRPYRPGVAPTRPFYRPTPPVTWNSTGARRLWSSILGINLGMSFNLSLKNLNTRGYNVDGYNSSELYLTNVSQFGYTWPDATMYYDNNGQFAGSRFYYSTFGYDNSRYNRLLSYLTQQHGAPASMVNNTDGMTATWYGSDNQYITLDFAPMMTDSGRRYFTILSIGN